MPAEAEAFIRLCTVSVSAEPGAALDQLRYRVLHTPSHPNLAPLSAATETRQIVWRVRENTRRDRACVSPGTSKRAEVCQAPELAQKPWQVPSLAGCSGPALRARACSQGSHRGVCKTLIQQLRSSGNALNSSDGR